MQRRFRQVMTSLKEHTAVSYAKIATAGGFCDLDLIVIKATTPDDAPLRDRYVLELLKIFSISQSSYRSFSISFARRFSGTQCWRVALKCLVLLHRLLRSLPESSPFRAEIFWARSHGWISLYPCSFRDCSSSASDDYTAFVRSYAQLLDEALDCFSRESDEEPAAEEEEEEKPAGKVSNTLSDIGRVLDLLPQLQSLMNRVMNCRPTGAAARSFIVQSAMKQIIRDSFTCYTTFRTEIIVVLENLIRLPYGSCKVAFGIYKNAAVQAHRLAEFYEWCKSAGLCGSYEYPFVDRIPEIQIRALEAFLNGMWQLAESSPSTFSPPTTSRSTSSFTEDAVGDSERQIVKKTEKSEEIEPLIQFEVDEEVSWEELLEASISPSNGGISAINQEKYSEHEGWKVQIYNPYGQHQSYYHHQYTMHGSYGSFPSDPAYPWGL